MSIRPTAEDPAWEAERRRAGVTAFLAGTAASFAFLAFFPGLPTSSTGARSSPLAVGGITRWARRSHMTRRRTTIR
ncbi:hypothetical protein ACFWUZ_29105 [Streptomyces sp. NPDC058646]|uniref:hypothetical protein n=1 Tax=Streptomyces sp. NPDC058646 TaxID=3346574 RepID=UPI0036461CEE